MNGKTITAIHIKVPLFIRKICLTLSAGLMLMQLWGCGSEFRVLIDKNQYYQLLLLNTTVAAIAGAGQRTGAQVGTIYWSEQTGAIKRISSTRTGETTLLTLSGAPLDIALYQTGQRIYWTEDTGTNFLIRSAGLDGSGVTEFLNEDGTSGNFGPTEIDIDQGTSIIYWNRYDGSTNDIWRSPLASLAKEEWVSAATANYNYISGIALDTANRKIYSISNEYWDISRVFSAGDNQDGNAFMDELDTYNNSFHYMFWGSYTPSPAVPLRGLAVAPAGGYVYYVDYKWDSLTIKRRNLALEDGSATVLVTASAGFDIHKIALDLTGRKIYWTSRLDNSLYRANLDTAESGIERFRQLTVVPTAIAIWN